MVIIPSPLEQLGKHQVKAICEKLGTEAASIIEQLSKANLIYNGQSKHFHGQSVMLSRCQFTAILRLNGAATILRQLRSVGLGYDGSEHDHPNTLTHRFFSSALRSEIIAKDDYCEPLKDRDFIFL